MRDIINDREYKGHITVKLHRLSLKGDLSAIFNTFLTPGRTSCLIQVILNILKQTHQIVNSMAMHAGCCQQQCESVCQYVQSNMIVLSNVDICLTLLT